MGLTAFFTSQIDIDEFETLIPLRVAEVQRDLLRCIGETGKLDLITPSGLQTSAFGVGDFVLADAEGRLIRRLDPFSELKRMAAGTDAREQIIACNVNTLFVVTSCNDDFNPARLERYLALALEAEVTPVIILTKADLAEDVAGYEDAARALMAGIEVIAVNALDSANLAPVRAWCGKGQTVALTGSSGVGKTTLLNALTGAEEATQSIREDDAKGRHTTTARSLHRMADGGWIIDTPGIRALRIHDKQDGIDAVFSDIAALADTCRFNDCAHESEPGCAVQAAIADGTLEHGRLDRWRKLLREDDRHSETVAVSRARMKKFGKMVKSAMDEKRRGGKH